MGENRDRSCTERELEEHCQVLFPIGVVPFSSIGRWKCLDADIGKDSAREVREYFIPDFSEMNYDSYQRAFERLVDSLKASEPARAAEIQQ